MREEERGQLLSWSEQGGGPWVPDLPTKRGFLTGVPLFRTELPNATCRCLLSGGYCAAGWAGLGWGGDGGLAGGSRAGGQGPHPSCASLSHRVNVERPDPLDPLDSQVPP